MREVLHTLHTLHTQEYDCVSWNTASVTHQQGVTEFESRLGDKEVIRIERDSDHVVFGRDGTRGFPSTPGTPSDDAAFRNVIDRHKIMSTHTELQ